MSPLALVIVAAQDVNVHLDAGGGLTTRDVLVPAGTLIAAVVGVVIGGFINRATLTSLDAERLTREDGREKARAEREDRMDERRAQRERDLEDERQYKADCADKRRAIGSVRLACRYLIDVRRLAEIALRRTDGRYLLTRERSPIGPDDEHLLASWLGRPAWDAYATASTLITIYQTNHEVGHATDDAWTERVQTLHGAIVKALNALTAEGRRLAHEIGDPDEGWVPPPSLLRAGEVMG